MTHSRLDSLQQSSLEKLSRAPRAGVLAATHKCGLVTLVAGRWRIYNTIADYADFGTIALGLVLRSSFMAVL